MDGWWSMGGYGPYVWSALGIWLAALGGLWLQSWVWARRRAAELADLQQQNADSLARKHGET